MRWLRLILGVLLLLAVVGAATYFVVGRGSPSEERVTLDLEHVSFLTEDGTNIALDDINARIRIIHFWASWNPSSSDELEALALLQEAFGDDIKAIAINRDAVEKEGQDFLAEHGLSGKLLYLYDKEDTYYKKIGGYNMPETVFVNKKDEVLAHVRGPMSYKDMESVLRALLAQ